MKYNKLKEFLFSYEELSFFEWKFCEKFLKFKKYNKGEMIQFSGDISQRLIYINSGIVRSYLLDENGNDFTWEIHFNDDEAGVMNLFVVDYDSFLSQTPSQIFVEVLEECEVVWITYDDLQLLYQARKKYERLGRKILEDGFRYLQSRFIDLSLKPARDRYENYIMSYENILTKVPQYHVATYLRISPQHLSTIKQKMKKN